MISNIKNIFLLRSPFTFSHTEFNPLITGVGKGFMVTTKLPVFVEQPVDITDSVNAIVPRPAAPQSTAMLLVPAPAVIVPPEIVQT